MSNIPTPHISCSDKSLIAKTVLMPGDPLRAKHYAEKYLTDVVCFTSTRNIFGYTGYYNGKRISIMGSGMGMPSIGIYSYELYKFYDVDTIIRVGSAGSYDADFNLYDVVLVTKAYSESNFAKYAYGYKSKTLKSNSAINNKLRKASQKLNINLKEATIHSSDVFYSNNSDYWKEVWQKHDCKCVEMESFALFANAKALNKKAACLLTISDSMVTHQATTALERQNSFDEMMKIALELANN